jgi:hypothetical protein
MPLNHWLFICALASPVWSQCYDLTATHLFPPDGRFKESWNKPLWNGKPGEANFPGNFRLDQQEYGKHALHFAIFMGVVRKTDTGWVSFHSERQPRAYCDQSGPRGSRFCWLPPYQQPRPDATPDPYGRHRETWSLSSAGVLTYVMKSRSSIPEKRESGTEDATATLNLETGWYEMMIRDHGKGAHYWAIKGGVELQREITFTARARLTPVECPASLEKVSLREMRRPRTAEPPDRRPCAVKVKSRPDQLPADFEFIQNPTNQGTPQGCIVVHEGPVPEELRLATGKD